MANDLPTADSLFADVPDTLPSADSLFQDAYKPKPIGPSATWGAGVGRNGTTGAKDFMAATSLGRIMDAFGKGAKEGWGQEPIGLSEENKLRIATGDYNPASKDWMTKPFTIGGAYTEAIAQPAAAAADILFRTPVAAIGGVTSAIQQTYAETAPKWLRQWLGMGQQLSTKVETNVTPQATANELNNQLGAALAFATMPDPVFAGLKPWNPEQLANRQQAFTGALNDVDKPKPVAPVNSEVPNITRKVDAPAGTPTDMNLGVKSRIAIKQDEYGKYVEYTDENGATTKHRNNGELKTQKDAEEYALDLWRRKMGDEPYPVASRTAQDAPVGALEEPATTLPEEAPVVSTAQIEAAKDISVQDLGEPGSLEGQILSINPDLVMYNQYGTHTSMVDIGNLSEVTGVPVDALIKRDSPYSSLDPVQSIKLEKAFKQMADNVVEAGKNVTDEASAMEYLKQRQKVIQSLVDVERKDYLKGLSLKAEQAMSKEDKLKARAVGTFFRDNNFEGAFTPDGKLTPEGLAAIQQEANEVRGINSAAGVNKYLRQKTKDQAGGFYSKTRDMALEYLYNWGMLSSPKTHAANVISNTLISILRVGETSMAGGIGSLRSLFTKADDRVYLGEGYQKLFGLVQGMPEGLKAAGRAFTREELTFGRSAKMEINKKAIPGDVGKAFRLPGNLMTAEDEFFKAMAYRASLRSQTYREAVQKGLRGQAFVDHLTKRIDNPTDEMRTQAYKEADYDTFTKELGKTGKQIEALGREWPVAKFLTFPFMRTPTNIFKFTMERTPLSLASQEVRNTLMGKNGLAARDEQVAKMVIGTGIMYLAYQWASQGQLTGNGPKDPIERAQWFGEGNRPNSIKVDGEWYRLDRLGPIGSWMSMAADANNIWDKRGRAIKDKLVAGDMPSIDELSDMQTLVMVAAGNIAQQLPALNGITEMSDALNEDDGYKLKRLLIGMSARVVPAIGQDIARMNDPYMRDIKTIQDALNARIPWKAQEVPEMLDTFGQPIPNNMQGWTNLLNPIQHTAISQDPIYKAMQDVGYQMARPNKAIGGVELTREQYREYWNLSGTASKIALTELINAIGPDWNTIPPGVRKEMMANTVKRVRSDVATLMKLKYFGKDNDIIKQMQERKMQILAPLGDE